MTAADAPLRPPIPYFGGKQTIGARIAAMLPEHSHYVEPFFGGGSVLFAKEPSPLETVNDLDEYVMGFWRVLRDRPDDLHRVCSLTPHSRAEFERSKVDIERADDLERARLLWVWLTQGRSGTLKPTGWRHHIDPGSRFGVPGYLTGYLARMAPVAQRLASVSLECRPALDVITAYGGCGDVLLYVDPPYLGTTRPGSSQGYRHEMAGAGEHARLLDALVGCRAAVVLSGYASDLYDGALAGWDRVEMATSTANGAVGDRARVEVVWSNRQMGTQPGLWDS